MLVWHKNGLDGSDGSSKVLPYRNVKPSMSKEQLWRQAFECLEDTDPSKEVLLEINHDVNIGQVQATVESRLAECISKQWEITKENGERLKVRSYLEKTIVWFQKFKAAGDTAIQYDPGHAALPWAAVRFLLQAAISSIETFHAMVQGLNCVPKSLLRTVVRKRGCSMELRSSRTNF